MTFDPVFANSAISIHTLAVDGVQKANPAFTRAPGWALLL